MNIIFVSSRLTTTRHLKLNARLIGMIAAALLVIILVISLSIQYVMLRYLPDNLNDELQSALSSIHHSEQQQQQQYMQHSLEVMATQVGQMQAEVQRLNALGIHLSEITDVPEDLFDFNSPPPQGGPISESDDATPLNQKQLEQELQKLSHSIEQHSDKLLALESQLQQIRLDSKMLPSSAPVKTGWQSSGFGWRTDPITGNRARHSGIDFVDHIGTPIYASAGGVVAFSGHHPQYGNMVEIDHGNDITTRYAHASKLDVQVGQVVRRGQKIAEIGNTGRSTGPHLHFEVRYKRVAQNPARFLKKDDG